VSQTPLLFSDLFPKRFGIFNQFFKHLLYVTIYARLQIFSIISNFDEVMPSVGIDVKELGGGSAAEMFEILLRD